MHFGLPGVTEVQRGFSGVAVGLGVGPPVDVGRLDGGVHRGGELEHPAPRPRCRGLVPGAGGRTGKLGLNRTLHRRSEVLGSGQCRFGQPDGVAWIVVAGLFAHVSEDVRAEGAVGAGVRGTQPHDEESLRRCLVVVVQGTRSGDAGQFGRGGVQPVADVLGVAGVVQHLGDHAQVLADRAEHHPAPEAVIETAPPLGEPFQILDHHLIHPLTPDRSRDPLRIEQPVVGKCGQPGSGEHHKMAPVHTHRLQDLAQRRDRPGRVPRMVQTVIGGYVERACARLPPQGCQGHRLLQMA